jgi:hypothetical protein
MICERTESKAAALLSGKANLEVVAAVLFVVAGVAGGVWRQNRLTLTEDAASVAFRQIIDPLCGAPSAIRDQQEFRRMYRDRSWRDATAITNEQFKSKTTKPISYE